MKKIIGKIILAAAVFPLTACNMDFDNPNAYAGANFWYGATNAKTGLSACYTSLANGYLFGGLGIVLEECATPNAYNYANTYHWNDLASGTVTSDAGIFAGRWKACYTGIGRCNTLLKYIDQNTELKKDEIEQMKAQARFLRALYYSTLVTYYYKVPLITDEPSTEQLNSTRTDRDVIMNFIFTELEEVAEILPKSYSKSDYGRATAGAALTLLARLRLFEASPLMNPDGNVTKWEEASDAAKKVMDLRIYDLYDDYGTLFTEAAENSCECIFDVQFIGKNQGHSMDITMRQHNSAAPLRDIVDSYVMKDGKPRSESTYSASADYADMDPRFYKTIVYPGSNWMGELVNPAADQKNFINRQTGYVFKKYTVYSDNVVPTNSQLLINASESPVNIMVFRYADVLLMYAEAMNEQGLLDEAVWNSTIKLIRKRAGFTMKAAYEFPGVSKDELREIIRRERRSEFAGEGLYYNDLRRWKTAETDMNNINIKKYDGTEIGTRNFNSERDYWWPVPSTEMVLSPSLAPNNPNW